MQPPINKVLINEPVIVYTTTRHHDFTMTLDNTRIPLHAQAVNYHYQWGDGTTTTTTSPGAPFPNHTVSHIYTTDSPTYITLTTTWKITAKDPTSGVWIDTQVPLTTHETTRTFEFTHIRTYLIDPTNAPPQHTN